MPRSISKNLALAVALVIPRPRAAQTLGALPFQYSPDFDLYNQAEAVKYFEGRFYEGDRGVLTDAQLQQVEHLRQRAFEEPALALAAAQVLYMFGWFRGTGQILRDNVISAAQLFERSIAASKCGADAPDWNENSCDIRWMHAALLYNWLGETEDHAAQGRSYLAKAHDLVRGLHEVPRYAGVSSAWTSPKDINFNAIRFPGKPSRSIWHTDRLPMGRFLEENHHVFKAELEAIINDPRDLYTQLKNLDPSREHLASPGGWDTLRIVRYHHWYDLFCEAAPLTCELIRSRPEIMNCSFMNVNYVKLHPGAHLKPHFGNAPRLSAHLSVIAPEPLRAGMTVGREHVLWVEGRAIVFDDTYAHCVSHWGSLPRYVMLVWFCHPCDDSNPHEQTCPDAL
mmetsp:Transcript_9367/g.26254  ORF Transcript_9367/g.26254 Transcript_9367/m.26254 type:complete len:396 (-) Transcript_9367:38-1225(-)